jgi:hypothetical protein
MCPSTRAMLPLADSRDVTLGTRACPPRLSTGANHEPFVAPLPLLPCGSPGHVRLSGICVAGHPRAAAVVVLAGNDACRRELPLSPNPGQLAGIRACLPPSRRPARECDGGRSSPHPRTAAVATVRRSWRGVAAVSARSDQLSIWSPAWPLPTEDRGSAPLLRRWSGFPNGGASAA